MKPLELEVQWFGQYTASQTIDFTHLDEVFLIAGETGAGKTTLFDAMTYALYGYGLGARKAGDSLRSQLAGPQDTTRVRFRFMAYGVTWEVERSPYTFVRLKRTGAVESDKYVTLTRLSGPGAPEHAAPGEVAQKIHAAIGLNYEDFSKILVLPQGEFQQFLAMKTKDRGELLKKLFPVEDHLALAKMASELVKVQRDRIKVIEAAQAEVGRGELKAKFGALELVLMERLAAEAAIEIMRLEAHKLAVASLHAGQTLKGQIDTLAKRMLERALHLITEPEQAARRVRLAEGRRAAEALPAVDQAEANRRESARIEGLVSAAKAEVGQAVGEVERLRPGAEQLPQREEALVVTTEAAGNLGVRLADLRGLEGAMKEAKRCRDVAEGTLLPVGPAKVALAAAEAAVAALDVAATEREALAPDLAAANQRVHACRLAERDAGEVTTWLTTTKPRGEADQADEAARVARLTGEEAKADAELGEAQRRVEADAALLVAAALKPGEPCLACGSLEHPHPRTGHPGEADPKLALRIAEKALKVAQEHRQTQQRLLGVLTARLEAAGANAEAAADRLRLAGHSSPEAWRLALSAALAEQAPLVKRDNDLAGQLADKPATVAAVNKARGSVEELERLARLSQAAASLADGAVAGAEARVGEVGVLADSIRNTDTLQREAVAANLREAAQIKALRTAWADAEATSKSAFAKLDTLKAEAEAKRILQPALDVIAADKLRDADFATVDAARAASVNPRNLEALQLAVSEWDRVAASLSRVITELETGIGGRPEPDVAALQSGADDAERAASAAAGKRRDVESELEALRARMERLLELEAEAAALVAETKGLFTLSKHLNGEVAPKIDFATWMLTWWLERVLVQANRRMHDLSASRYAFRLRTAVVDGRSCAGLDIDVLDTWSNKLRDVNALSGGEKFLASLSLALGLADVVQGRNAGVQLNTLFIDEGFGSLDAATLDLAMDLIRKIAKHRSVGLISHVEAMQKTIASQIQVTKSPAGSQARVV